MTDQNNNNNRPPISAYIRTLNESRMIGDVIDAAFLLVREVVIVDSGSTDGTIDIATAKGAKIIHQEWLGNGGQKRAGEDHAAYDWVLDIDGDEVLTPEFAAEVIAMFTGNDGAWITPDKPIYNTPLVNVPPVGKPWYGYGQSVRHKLYNKTYVRIPDHPAWDQFDIPKRSDVGYLKKAILHYAFDGAALFIQKVNKNSSTRAQHVKMKPMPLLIARILFGMPIYFAKRYFINGLWRGGVYGFAFSWMSGFGRWMRDVKMYEKAMKEKGKSLYDQFDD